MSIILISTTTTNQRNKMKKLILTLALLSTLLTGANAGSYVTEATAHTEALALLTSDEDKSAFRNSAETIALATNIVEEATSLGDSYVATQIEFGVVYTSALAQGGSEYESFWRAVKLDEALQTRIMAGTMLFMYYYSDSEVFADPATYTLLRMRKHNKGWESETNKLTYTLRVITPMLGTGLADDKWKAVVSEVSAILTTEERVSLLAKEKDGLLLLPSRTSAQDSYLTKVSADLMAYKLD
tara:strand:+ start:88139 stop:88864 length:726 start_codon:yes stop_codon:yes gene_type:complete